MRARRSSSFRRVQWRQALRRSNSKTYHEPSLKSKPRRRLGKVTSFGPMSAPSHFTSSVAQVLLTHGDLRHRALSECSQYLSPSFAWRRSPSSTNDTVSVEEIKLGDNDSLSAMVADLVQADLLLISPTSRTLPPIHASTDGRVHRRNSAHYASR
jgi:hypothetical protein